MAAVCSFDLDEEVQGHHHTIPHIGPPPVGYHLISYQLRLEPWSKDQRPHRQALDAAPCDILWDVLHEHPRIRLPVCELHGIAAIVGSAACMFRVQRGRRARTQALAVSPPVSN